MSLSPYENDAAAELDAAASALERSSVAAAHHRRGPVPALRPPHARDDGFAVPVYASPSIPPAADLTASPLDLADVEPFVRRRHPGAKLAASAVPILLGLALIGAHFAYEGHAEKQRVAELEQVRQRMLELRREAELRAEAQARANQIAPAAPPSTVAALLAASTRKRATEAPSAQKPRGATHARKAVATRRSLARKAPVRPAPSASRRGVAKRRPTPLHDLKNAGSRSRSKDPIYGL